jgi:hypothetical protein
MKFKVEMAIRCVYVGEYEAADETTAREMAREAYLSEVCDGDNFTGEYTLSVVSDTAEVAAFEVTS